MDNLELLNKYRYLLIEHKRNSDKRNNGKTIRRLERKIIVLKLKVFSTAYSSNVKLRPRSMMSGSYSSMYGPNSFLNFGGTKTGRYSCKLQNVCNIPKSVVPMKNFIIQSQCDFKEMELRCLVNKNIAIKENIIIMEDCQNGQGI